MLGRNLSFNTSTATRNVMPLSKVLKTFCLRLRRSGSSFSLNKNVGKSKFKSKFERHKNLKTDVIVYSHENDKFYLLFGYFGAIQMGLCIYMAFAVQQFGNISSELSDSTDVPWYKWLILKQGQFKNSFSILCIAVGKYTFSLNYQRCLTTFIHVLYWAIPRKRQP